MGQAAVDAQAGPELPGLACWGYYYSQLTSEEGVPMRPGAAWPYSVRVDGQLAAGAIPGGAGGEVACDGGFPARLCSNAGSSGSWRGQLQLSWDEAAGAWRAVGEFHAESAHGGAWFAADCTGEGWLQ